MTHTHHTDGGAEAGWFAANFMLLMIILVAAVIIIGGAFLWQPWASSSDDGEGGLDVNVDVTGDDGEGGGDGGGESSNYRIAPDRIVVFA